MDAYSRIHGHSPSQTGVSQVAGTIADAGKTLNAVVSAPRRALRATSMAATPVQAAINNNKKEIALGIGMLAAVPVAVPLAIGKLLMKSFQSPENTKASDAYSKATGSAPKASIPQMVVQTAIGAANAVNTAMEAPGRARRNATSKGIKNGAQVDQPVTTKSFENIKKAKQAEIKKQEGLADTILKHPELSKSLGEYSLKSIGDFLADNSVLLITSESNDHLHECMQELKKELAKDNPNSDAIFMSIYGLAACLA